MTRYSNRKRRVRQRMTETGETYQQALRALTDPPADAAAGMPLVDDRPRLMLPLDAPYNGPGHCRECLGTGQLGNMTVAFAPDEATTVLVCHVFCPRCSGCGHAEHTACRIDQHAFPEEVGVDPNGWDDDDLEDEDLAEDTCPSCRGRRWWPMQAFNATEVYAVRVPCGCSADLLVPAPAATR